MWFVGLVITYGSYRFERREYIIYFEVIVMKKMCKFVGVFLVLALLAACAQEIPEVPSGSSSAAPVELSTDVSSSSPDNSFSAASDGFSVTAPDSKPIISDSSNGVSITSPNSETASLNDTNLKPAEATLQFYDSFRDIPFVDIEYGTYWEDNSIDKGSLDKNGGGWCCAPGMMQFGERCFTDGTKLWIQVYMYPSDDFDWYQICFDHFHDDKSIWIDAPKSSTDEWITLNKLFTHADGYTVYTDDGFSFTVEPCSP